jgi:hypothetical protein
VDGVDDRRLISRTREFLAASFLLLWRAACYPAALLWRDWVFLLAAFWLFTIVAGRTKAWTWVLGLLMTALFVLYSWHQVPLTLSVLGALR